MRKVKKYTKIGLSGVMTVLLSGTVFLLCCATSSSAQQASCPLKKAKAAHCDRSASNALNAAGNPTEEPSSECCGFLALVYNKARKLERGETVSVAVASSHATVRPERISLGSGPTSQPVIDYRGFPVNKSQTFLRNRTFRI
jgi:hypothetical protein